MIGEDLTNVSKYMDLCKITQSADHYIKKVKEGPIGNKEESAEAVDQSVVAGQKKRV